MGDYGWCLSACSCTYSGTHKGVLFENAKQDAKQSLYQIILPSTVSSALLVCIFANTLYCCSFLFSYDGAYATYYTVDLAGCH